MDNCKQSKDCIFELTKIYILQNNLAQGLTEEEFVYKYIEVYDKISTKLSDIQAKTANDNVESFQKIFY